MSLVTEEYEKNFRVFRANPAYARYWKCRICWLPLEEHWGPRGHCPWSLATYQLATVEEELEWRREKF